MPLITAAAAVTAIWAGLELMGKVMSEETVKRATLPITDLISNWIKQKSGWEDKYRERVFRDAYLSAEELLIKQIGFTEAHRTFRTINRIVDEDVKREFFALAILEENEISRKKLLDMKIASSSFAIQENWSGFGIRTTKDVDDLAHFAKYLRQSLFMTEIYRPFIEAYALEDAKEIREQMLLEITKLSKTIDNDLNAIRVKIIETTDFHTERQVYLKQLQAFFTEQEFVGFPDLREQKTPLLLNDIFIPLRLQYLRGGEKMDDEIGKLLNIVAQEGK